MDALTITKVCKLCQRALPEAQFLRRSGNSSRRCVQCLTDKLTRRFWSKVDKHGPVHPVLGTECWLWTGARRDGLHGRITVSVPVRDNVFAHRFSFAQCVGPIPDGMSVLHRCDVAHCVRPDHLFLGNQDDNMKDAALKQRVRRGPAHHSSKLTPDDVRAIRALRGTLILEDIARHFGVRRSTIQDVLSGRTWSHVA